MVNTIIYIYGWGTNICLLADFVLYDPMIALIEAALFYFHLVPDLDFSSFVFCAIVIVGGIKETIVENKQWLK